jgi:hypothetical protein
LSQLDVLARLAATHEALIRALDGNDLAAIEGATLALADAIASARAQPDWAGTPDMRERLLNLAALAQAAQIRVNFLTDTIRRRVNMLAALRGAEPANTYQPNAR